MSEQTVLPESSVPDLDAGSVAGNLVRSYLNEISRTPLLNSEEEVSLSRRIEAGVFAGHLLDLQSQLESEPDQISAEDKLLADKYRAVSRSLEAVSVDGQSAKDSLIRANLKLVVSIAKRYQGRGLDLIDLIQEGNFGLIHAVEKFDYTKGYKFSTYGTWWIRQAVSRGLAEKCRTIRVPHYLMDEVNKYSRLNHQFFQDNGREATDQEIAELIGDDVDKARLLKELNLSPVSLDRAIGADTKTTIGDIIEDKTAVQPEASTLDEITILKVAASIDQLDPRQALIIKRRYGMGNHEPQTLKQLSAELGITKERVRQIQILAEKQLRVIFEQLGITNFNDD
jgi:RNA polymerase sigma factor (sigma-70 family)